MRSMIFLVINYDVEKSNSVYHSIYWKIPKKDIYRTKSYIQIYSS